MAVLNIRVAYFTVNDSTRMGRGNEENCHCQSNFNNSECIGVENLISQPLLVPPIEGGLE